MNTLHPCYLCRNIFDTAQGGDPMVVCIECRAPDSKIICYNCFYNTADVFAEVERPTPEKIYIRLFIQEENCTHEYLLINVPDIYAYETGFIAEL